MTTLDISDSQEIYSVSQLNREVRFILEGSFPTLWIEGEISNFVVPGSGHWYFSLKDSLAQVKCAMFKPQNRRLNFTPKNGMQVLVKARVSLYEGTGAFQILIDHLEEAGEGKLRQEFEALKQRLSAAGLFDQQHKKSLPIFPRTIGVITSPTGAAIRDILNVLSRRFPCSNVIIYPTLVQGDTAAPTIVKAIETANQRNECDVLIVARGGGSLEDLWPFNDERVALAIFNSVIPIVSGVGHEIDFTIADFVADLRAPTPSAAAELITPDKEELIKVLQHQQKQLQRCMQQKLLHLQKNIEWSTKHLQQQHPKRRLREQAQQLDFCEITLVRLQNKTLTQLQAKLHTLHAKFSANTPAHQIRRVHQLLSSQEQRAALAVKNNLQNKLQLIANLAGKLDALSPLATLQRGFAIATHGTNQEVLQSSTQIHIGDKIHVRLSHGKLGCTVFERDDA